MRCVNCKKQCEPFKVVTDTDPTRRNSYSRFYKGKRTTKYWCEPCWVQWEADYKAQQERADEDLEKMRKEMLVERQCKELNMEYQWTTPQHHNTAPLY